MWTKFRSDPSCKILWNSALVTVLRALRRDGRTDQSLFCSATNDPAAATAKRWSHAGLDGAESAGRLWNIGLAASAGGVEFSNPCFFFPSPKPPQMWLTGRIILSSSSASQTAPPWRRPSLSGEIRAFRCHDGVQWHTELSRAEAEEYEIQNRALFSV